MFSFFILKLFNIVVLREIDPGRMTAIVFMLNMRSGLNGALFVQRSGTKKREWKTEIIAPIIL